VDHFVGLGLRFAGAKAGGEIDGHGFGDESGAGVKVKDAAPMGGSVAGFLEEFAFSCGQRLFAGIDAPGREFPQKVVGGVSILSLQQDVRLGARFVYRQHYDGAGVMNDVAAGADASGLLYVVRGHPEDRATINSARGNYPCLGVGTLAGLRRL